VDVGSADPGGIDTDHDVPWTGHRVWQVDLDERSAVVGDGQCAHQREARTWRFQSAKSDDIDVLKGEVMAPA
jgi:hypothetical protein